MAKIEQMLRIKFIEELLRRRKEKGASYEEIKTYLEQKFEEKDRLQDLKFTDRTFLRDKDLIREISGIEISYSRSRNAYYIAQEELDIYEENIFDNLLLVEAYRETKNHGDIMIFEPRRARGLENLHGLIHAIKNQKLISFSYESYWNPEKSRRLAEPYALKEFEHRWYLLAMDHQPSAGKKIMKCFGLDRISDLDIKQKTFPRQPFSAAEMYRDSFGIIAPDGTLAEEIILQFDSHQGNYIKSMPLHHSQCVVEDGTHYLTIKLNLVPTYDFVQQLLHFGSRVKVIKPHALRITIQEELQKALNLY